MIKPNPIWSVIALLAVSFQSTSALGADGHHYRSGGDPSTIHIELRRHVKQHGRHEPSHPGSHTPGAGRRGHKGGIHEAPYSSGWNRVHNSY